MSDTNETTTNNEIDNLCDLVEKVDLDEDDGKFEEIQTIVKKTKKILPKKEEQKQPIQEPKVKEKKSDAKDSSWRYIFKELSYDGESELRITADMIKEIGKKAPANIKSQFEPRLLCYQDSFENRPNVFKEKNLFILAIKNGIYMIVKNNIYFNLSYDTEEPIIQIKRNVEFDDVLDIGNSENSLLDNLLVSKVYEREELIGEPLYPRNLLGGRHYTKSFDMKIHEKELQVNSVQYETDGCYISDHYIVLIECKNKRPESFNIRQFYYSYRTIFDNLVKRKSERKMICLFVGADKGITYIWKFTFEDPKVLTSMKCKSLHRYCLI